MKLDIDRLKSWIGHQEILEDLVTPVPVAALSATLDRDDPKPGPGAVLPPLWHWLYFLPLHKQSEIGPDGHAKRGGFLPPVPLPRRMWAGGRLKFDAPLPIGVNATRTSRILSVAAKQGRSGNLAFVTVQHQIAHGATVAVTEEHDIVYRDMPAKGAEAAAPKMAPVDATWSRIVTPDPVLLFRYSALTFNGHRIHYDRSYVTSVEGYPGLIVHGPLQATLLLQAAAELSAGGRIAAFAFRATRPLFDLAPFTVNGRRTGDRGADLWVAGPEGVVHMQATAEWA